MKLKLSSLIKILLTLAVGSLAGLLILILIAGPDCLILNLRTPASLLTYDVNIERKIVLTNIDTIEIDFTSQDVNIVPVTGNEMTLLYAGSISSSWEISEPFILLNSNNRKMDIELPRVNFSGTGSIHEDLVLNLGIPEKSLADLIVSTSSGNIHIQGNPASRLIVDTTSGTAYVNGFSGYNLRVNTSSGDQTLENIRFNGSLEIQSSSGDITAEVQKSGGTILAESSSGNIDIAIPENADYTLHLAHTPTKEEEEEDMYDKPEHTKIHLFSYSGDASLNHF
ncbi:MAG: DUF4097 family beta strand repeat protein [Spirochaetales bacterium]|nr:DUF4097 family beta strand repeat protein [Spirochaetales bacterium]